MTEKEASIAQHAEATEKIKLLESGSLDAEGVTAMKIKELEE